MDLHAANEQPRLATDIHELPSPSLEAMPVVDQGQPSENENGYWCLDPGSNAAPEDLQYSKSPPQFVQDDIAMAMPNTSNNVRDNFGGSSINTDSNPQMIPGTDTSNGFLNSTSSCIPSNFELPCQAVGSILQSRNGDNTTPLIPAIRDISEISYIESMSCDINDWDMDTFDGMQAFNTNVRVFSIAWIQELTLSSYPIFSQ